MELKTLDDFIGPLQKAEKKFKTDFSPEGKTNWIAAFSSINSLMELKAEAVKWVKELEKEEDTALKNADKILNDKFLMEIEMEAASDRASKRCILMDFFNLTVDDLK